MKKAILVLFLVSVCLSDTIKFQSFTQFEEISSSDSNVAPSWHKKWNNYLPYKCRGNKHSIIEETLEDHWAVKDQKGHGFGEGFTINILATRWDYSNGLNGKKIWQINSSGSSSKIVNDLYVVTQNPCCESESSYKYFSMETGKQIQIFTKEIINVSTKSKNRYFGYVKLNCSFTPDKTLDHTKYAGIGYLISDTSTIAKINIPLRVKDTWPASPNLEGDSVLVRLHYFGDVIIEIGIKNDQLILKN